MDDGDTSHIRFGHPAMIATTWLRHHLDPWQLDRSVQQDVLKPVHPLRSVLVRTDRSACWRPSSPGSTCNTRTHPCAPTPAGRLATSQPTLTPNSRRTRPVETEFR